MAKSKKNRNANGMVANVGWSVTENNGAPAKGTHKDPIADGTNGHT